jgi:hypothetical protein
MAIVYIEPRPKGRPEGDPIDDYVVEDHADHFLASFKTQREAIEWAKKNVARLGLAMSEPIARKVNGSRFSMTMTNVLAYAATDSTAIAGLFPWTIGSPKCVSA